MNEDYVAHFLNMLHSVFMSIFRWVKASGKLTGKQYIPELSASPCTANPSSLLESDFLWKMIWKTSHFYSILFWLWEAI